jgi:putative DNA primase/helicase
MTEVSALKEQAKDYGATELLQAMDIPEQWLERNRPCPRCNEGTDRYSYSNKFGDGSAYCRTCGPLDLFDLVKLRHKCGFLEALRMVSAIIQAESEDPGTAAINRAERAKRREKEEYTQHLREQAIERQVLRIVSECRPLQHGDEVDRYWRNRGIALDRFPTDLLLHPALPYRESDKQRKCNPREDGKELTYPALIQVIRNRAWIVGVQRTWLKDGTKAPVPKPRKILGKKHGITRLFNEKDFTGDAIGLGEGLETVLSYAILYKRTYGIDLPVISCVDAGTLERLAKERVELPEQVRNVYLIVDKDRKRAGEAKAKPLADWLHQQGRRVFWELPEGDIPTDDKSLDWNDVLRGEQ